MKKYLILVLFFALSFIAGFTFNKLLPKLESKNIAKQLNQEPDKPLNTYTIENLRKTDIKAGIFTIKSSLDESDNYRSEIFNFSFYPNPTLKEEKSISGLINTPKTGNPNDTFPIVILIRGFVDQKIYQTGIGTQRVGEYFAENGFITVAPDFLGYADSDPESVNIFETRFQTYTTMLSLLATVNQIPNWDAKNIEIWAHSNGGQIALTVLEITKGNYPTVLWAPVSKPFPYSILYYTDESQDKGKYIRSELSKFEELYNADVFSLDGYLSNISAPIEIHQGTNDDAVPLSWSQALYTKIKNIYKENENKKDIILYTYPGADHNLQPSWNQAIEKSTDFFKKHLTNNQ